MVTEMLDNKFNHLEINADEIRVTEKVSNLLFQKVRERMEKEQLP